MKSSRAVMCAIALIVVSIALGSQQSRAGEIPDLRADSGPYLILVKDFRGPAAEGVAQSLAAELRDEHKLTVYLYRREKRNAREVSVFVGGPKTLKDVRALLRSVKTIEVRTPVRASFGPKWGNDLKRSLVTTNPLAQPPR